MSELEQILIEKTNGLKCITGSQINMLMLEENTTDIKKLVNDSVVIKDIMTDLGSMIDTQGIALENANSTIEQATDNIVEAEKHIDSAKKSFFRSHLIKGTILSTVLGLVLGGIGGGFIGYAVASSAIIGGTTGAVVGSGVSGATGYAIIKQKSS
jgi:hypothetical protein